MIRHTFTDAASRYERITQRNAKRLFEAGKPFHIIAHKMRPGFPFSLGMNVDSASLLQDWKESYGEGPHPTVPTLTAFTKLLQDFCWHNANCHETGTYAAFYVVTERKQAVA